jgi:hypothetical protein
VPFRYPEIIKFDIRAWDYDLWLGCV